jgi:hypothetical protein
MKTILRRQNAFVLIALILAVMVSGIPAARRAAADQLRVPKVISILYDDSGSMVTSSGMLGKAEYAKYAVNAFLALLDTEDIVYVTLMSKPDAAYRLTMENGQASAIDQLNGLIGNDLTPFRALTTAISALENARVANASSLYWLVVFTDGDFDNGSIGDAEQALDRFLHTPMPNGTLPQACFISIGSGAKHPEKAIDGLTLYPASGTITQNEDISNVMRAMADRISGRIKLDESSLSIQGKTVTFTTAYPCFSFAFLQQQDPYPWVSLSDASGNDYPGGFVKVESAGTLESISAWASKVSPQNGNILPAGTYTLSFREPPGDLIVMIEPALVLDLNMSAWDTGSELPDDIFRVGRVDVQGFLHFWQDLSPVSANLLPENTSYSLKALQGGSVIQESQSAAMTLRGVDFTAMETLFTGTVEVPNIGVVTASQKIALPLYTITLQQDGSDTYTLHELVQNTRGITATILRDGTPVSAEEASALTLLVETDVPYTCAMQSDGTYRICPWLDRLKPLSVYGRQAVSVTLKDASGAIAPSSSAWTIQSPVIEVQASLLGTGSIARTAMYGSMGLLQNIQSPSELQTSAQDHVIAAFTVTADGRRLNSTELADWQPVTVSLSDTMGGCYACDTKVTDDGTILAVPYYAASGILKSDLLRWIDSWHLPILENSVVCTVMNGNSATQPFFITLEPWYLLLLHIFLPLLLVAIVLGYVFKRRFERGATVRWIRFQSSGERSFSNADPWQEESLRRKNFRSFVPYATERARVCGLLFYPGTPSSLLIPLESLPERSQLIPKKRCALFGAFSCSMKEEDMRPVHVGDLEADKRYRCVLADNDILLFTGDGRTGYAFSYTQDGAQQAG